MCSSSASLLKGMLIFPFPSLLQISVTLVLKKLDKCSFNILYSSDILFDDAEVEQVAQETQTQKQDVYSAISTVLPQIIDSLTPQAGQTNQQEANADIQQVMNLVSGFLKR